MMNMMTLFMGAMFWHQPAGLCIYFIASSLWSIAERKLLGTGAMTPTTSASGASVEVIESNNSSKPAAKSKASITSAPAAGRKVPGFLQKLLDAAQTARDQAEQQREKESRKGKKR